MPFQIIRNDITKVKADAIVNTANPRPEIGHGTDSAIYAAAGADSLLAARSAIGEIAPGHASFTEAFNLKAKYVIHTVGPAWEDGSHGERDILRSCYEKSLTLAEELKCKSIAFPLIATGVYGFPKDEALNIALSEIGKYLLTHEMKVILVVFDRTALELSQQLAGNIEQYIDEHSARKIHEAEYSGGYGVSMRRRESAGFHETTARHIHEKPLVTDEIASNGFIQPAGVLRSVAGKSLDAVLSGKEETFQQRLFKLIDASGMDDVSVYKAANIDRKVFSRIRCKVDYKPTKKTAVAFAIALKLDLQTTLDLLSRAEIAFSPSNEFDLIVAYFISNRIYDILQINTVLFAYGQPTLGTA